MRAGILLIGIYAPARLIALVQMIEGLGFDTFWHGDDKFYRDTFVDLALCATHTERLELGIAVLEPYTRHPALTACTVATLDELSGGRMIVGLGAGGSGFEALGIERAHPALRLREAMEVMRAVWRGEPSAFSGETLSFHGQARFPMLRPSMPIVLGTRGPRIYELAGELADGALISTCADPAGIEDALSHLAAGARRAGRSLSDLRLICRLDTCVADDPALARAAVKSNLVASLRSSYPNWQFLQAMHLEVPEPIREAIASRDRGRIAAVASQLPDSFSEQLALAGTPRQVADQIRRIAATGIGELLIYPIPLPGQAVEEQITAIRGLR